MKILLSFLFAALVLCGTGCSKPNITLPGGLNKPTPAQVHDGAKFAVGTGLVLAKVKPEVVTQVKAVINEDILPYINGQVGISATAFDIAVKAKLTAKLPFYVVTIISGATYLLDSAIHEPKMNAQTLEYMRQFFIGASEGCDGALSGTTRSAKDLPRQKGKWFR